jgi:hypothetical protein
MKRRAKKMHAAMLFLEYDYLGSLTATDIEEVLKKYNL